MEWWMAAVLKRDACFLVSFWWGQRQDTGSEVTETYRLTLKKKHKKTHFILFNRSSAAIHHKLLPLTMSTFTYTQIYSHMWSNTHTSIYTETRRLVQYILLACTLTEVAIRRKNAGIEPISQHNVLSDGALCCILDLRNPHILMCVRMCLCACI